MKINLSFFTMLSILALASCKKYEPQYEGPYSDGDLSEIKHNRQILYVSDGQIHLVDQFLLTEKILSNAPSNVERASINNAHDMVAAWSSGENIVVLDTNDVVQSTIEGTEFVDWFEWHPNDKTLVIAKEGKLTQYGPTVQLATNDLAEVFSIGGTQREIPAFSMAEDGTLYFTSRYYANFDYFQRFHVYTNTSSGTVVNAYNLPPYPLFDHVRASADGNYIAISSTSQSNTQSYDFETSSGQLDFWGSENFLVHSPDSKSQLYHTGSYLYIRPIDISYATGEINALDW